MEPTVGEIILFGAPWAPQSWMTCEGQELEIAKYPDLFKVIGGLHGGDGKTTFKLPDLRGRIAVGTGSVPGGSSFSLGAIIGTNTVTLSEAQMPTHTHMANANSAAGNTAEPSGAFPAAGEVEGVPPNVAAKNTLYSEGSSSFMSAQMLSHAGGGKPHNNIQPSMISNFIICVEGKLPKVKA